ncbi:MAG: gamma-glutamyl-gamma-aminobutyrate hydrolase family protein [Deltaproteobacteria bacterium]|nr:gamma-glutamyl-gamma-aminobutyrate hydrolase family protein [Deltaproteobacteria bacterium]
MKQLLLLNLNLDPGELPGCQRIAAAMTALGATVEIAHHAQWPDARGVDGLLLGPQGTPFAAYPDSFLPELRAWTDRSRAPLLAICGGMQALALAHGGQLGTVDGGPQAQGSDYGDRPRISGPISVTRTGPLPADWRGPASEELHQVWKNPQSFWQSHAEQVTQVPAGWRVLAQSAATPIEAYVAAGRPWLGCQFHPERGWLAGEKGCPTGKLLLQAWLENLGGPATA